MFVDRPSFVKTGTGLPSISRTQSDIKLDFLSGQEEDKITLGGFPQKTPSTVTETSIAPPEEINELMKKFVGLPEKDRKELLYLAKFKEGEYIQKRVLEICDYILGSQATVRRAAQVFQVSESTVREDMFERLPLIDKQLAQEVKKILKAGKEENSATKEGVEYDRGKSQEKSAKKC